MESSTIGDLFDGQIFAYGVYRLASYNVNNKASATIWSHFEQLT